MIWIWTGLFAVFGACLRLWLSQSLGTWQQLPLATLAVNSGGGLLAGTALVLAPYWIQDPMWRTAFAAGFLGSLTTFSTFSLETVLMFEQEKWLSAFFNILSNNFLAILFCWLGVRISRLLI